MAKPLLDKEQRQWVADTYATHSRRETWQLFEAKWPGVLSLTQLVSFVKNHKLETVGTGRYENGNKPWSAGKKIGTRGRTAQTQFKRGQVPLNTKQLGHERRSKDGYVLIQVQEQNPHTGYKHRYLFKHRVLWEQQHGPVPDGKILRSRDGDKANCDPNNWVVVSRAEHVWLTRKGFQHVPEDFRDLMIAAARMDVKAREVER